MGLSLKFTALMYALLSLCGCNAARVRDKACVYVLEVVALARFRGCTSLYLHGDWRGKNNIILVFNLKWI